MHSQNAIAFNEGLIDDQLILYSHFRIFNALFFTPFDAWV